MRIVGPLVCIALIVPVAASQGGLILGTEELPELPPSGPPSYAATYTGARDHTYLEILAGWFSHDNQTDEIFWTLKTAEGNGYANPPDGWSVQCVASGNVTGGAAGGSLRFLWRRDAGTSGTSSVLFTYAAGNSGGVGETNRDSINHRFASVLETPAYFQFRVDRADLLRYGAQIEDFDGRCSEFHAPSPVVGVATGTTMPNYAASTSRAIYSFTQLRRVQAPDGSLDPIEKFERTNQTVSPSTTMTDDSERTPAIGLPATILALATIGCAGRRLKKPE